MGGGIPTRWRRYDRQNRDGRDDRLSLQIGCSPLSNLFKKSSFLDTFGQETQWSCPPQGVLKNMLLCRKTMERWAEGLHKAMSITPLSFCPEACSCVERQWSGAQRTLREPSGAFRGRSEVAQRTFKGRSEAFRGRSEDVQATLRGRLEDVQRRSEDVQRRLADVQGRSGDV